MKTGLLLLLAAVLLCACQSCEQNEVPAPMAKKCAPDFSPALNADGVAPNPAKIIIYKADSAVVFFITVLKPSFLKLPCLLNFSLRQATNTALKRHRGRTCVLRIASISSVSALCFTQIISPPFLMDWGAFL